ncbi:MAG: aspartoacylase [Natronospirillum sp.]
MTQILKSVAVVGGTHGNEITGVHLLQYWQAQPSAITQASFDTELVLANPQAHAKMTRYLDQDLNRQFKLADLNNPALTGYEHSRAKVLNTLLGPKEDPRVDFVIDLHTTTANMGLTLVISDITPLLLDLVFYIKQQMPEAVLFYEPKDRVEDVFLTSLGRYNGLLIEVGPSPQGVLRGDVFDLTRRATEHALQFLHWHNVGQVPALPDALPAFEFVERMEYPCNAQGERWGMVHPQAQDADYTAVNTGDPLFLTFDGGVVTYQGEPTRYLSFVNEAAYYASNVGLELMRQFELKRRP